MTRTAFLPAAVTALALAAAGQPAAAQATPLYDGYSHDPSKVVTYTRVHLSRADLKTSAGARVALQQIEAAADAVCGGPIHARVAPKDYDACLTDAIDRAVRTLGAPEVKAAATEGRKPAALAAR